VLLNPKVIIEVLSVGTARYDLTEKFRRYRTHLPSLMDYILVSQTEPVIEHYRRQPNGDWLLSTLEGADAALRIESIGCAVSLSDAYARVEFETSQPEENDDEVSTGESNPQ
jgi:Uma2 family endonuclease